MPIGCHKTTQRMGRKQGIRQSFVPCSGFYGAVSCLSEGASLSRSIVSSWWPGGDCGVRSIQRGDL